VETREDDDMTTTTTTTRACQQYCTQCKIYSSLSEHGRACHFGTLPSLPRPLGHACLITSKLLFHICVPLLCFSAGWPPKLRPLGAFVKVSKYAPHCPALRQAGARREGLNMEHFIERRRICKRNRLHFEIGPEGPELEG